MIAFGQFDWVIVGAGTAGCVLANRLSADPRRRVLLIEAGGRDTYPWIHIPVGYLFTLNNPRTDWCFKTEPQAGLAGRAIGYPRGKVLGGCTAINGMIYMRGQSADYDLWRQMGNVGWGWDDVLPLFRRSQDEERGADEAHGAGGEWRIESMRLSWEILDAFRAAAAETGIPPTEDFNRGDNEGCGYFRVTQRRGVRWTTAKAFLRPVRRRPNLAVVTHAHVQRLVIEEGRATGVVFRRDGVEHRVQAGEVVLAAGAVGSPHLLELSGVGDARRLADLGIAPVLDRPAVGENLQDHLQVRLAYRVRGTRTLNEASHSLFAKAGMVANYAARRRGPLTMAPSQLGAFTRSDPSMATPNLEWHIQPLTTDRLGEPLHREAGFTASVCNLRPVSRGSIHARSADAAVPPAIDPNYLADPADRRVAVDAVRLTRRICAAPALARYHPQEFKPGAERLDDAAILEGVAAVATTIFHPVGTCRMGTDPDAVVDPRLRVCGIGGLRIADASIMPRITSGNTAAPTIMIGEKAAEMMLADAR
jgi:choline dehydrogenase